LDGFGQEVRRIEEAPRVNGQSRYFGVSTRRNMATLQITTTLPASCGADPHCLALAGGSQPREVVSTDALGRAIVMQTPAGFSKFDYRSVIRSHPDTGSQSFDAVLAMDPRGYLTQRIFDGDDLVWVEECGNPAIGVPETADLTNVQCENTGPNAAVTFYRYERTGEVREVYDALAASNTNPAQASLRYVNDSLGRVREIHDINRTGPILKAYNAAGEVDQETNARGQVITSGHDGLGRLTTMSYSIGGGVTQEYSIGYDSRTRLAELIQQKNISQVGPARSSARSSITILWGA
jgi:YD repeat-containing protein